MPVSLAAALPRVTALEKPGTSKTPGLTVSLIDGVRLDCRRAGLEHFDALIVDEGQDLFEMRCIETLGDVLVGGLETGRWCWFHDLNNQSLTARFDPRAKEYLESLEPVRMSLRINCRNTRVILEWIQDTLDAANQLPQHPGHPGMDTGHTRRRPWCARGGSRPRCPLADRTRPAAICRASGT